MAPEHFLARCSRKGVNNSGVCLLERRIGNADITFRFPRDWLTDWQNVASGIDRLIARLHPGDQPRRSPMRKRGQRAISVYPAMMMDFRLRGNKRVRRVVHQIHVEDRQFENVRPAAFLDFQKQHRR